jgi:23S rRNA (adenine-N6)-dimethyltransferase
MSPIPLMTWSPHASGTSCRQPSGVHFLATPQSTRLLVKSCPVGTADLVLDLGVGQGAVTAPLPATGPGVLAVERDP